MSRVRPLATAEPAEVGLCPQACRRLINALGADVARQRLPGAVVAIARRGRLAVFEALGRRDPAEPDPMATDAVFRIYSMTKPLVSVAVMMAAERGEVVLSDPICRFLPVFAHPRLAPAAGDADPLPTRVPTIHDLLRHTAGMTYEFLGDAPVQRSYQRLQLGSRERSNRELVDTLATVPLMHEPGTVWSYSRATDVLGHLLEVISGQTLGQHLKQAVFDPLGMVDTGFHVPEADHHRIAQPFAHDPDGGVPLRVFDPRRPAALENGGGGLMSTAMDYMRFLMCLRNGGELDGVRLLGPRTLAHMTSDHLGPIPVTGPLLPPGHGFGLGFAVRTRTGLCAEPGSAGLYYWEGLGGTGFFVDPAQDLFATLMIQAPNQRDHYRALFRQLVYAALLD